MAATSAKDKKCPCKCNPTSSDAQGMYMFDEKTIKKILSSFDEDEYATEKDAVIGPGGRARKIQKQTAKEPCMRPGCIHWQPPRPCCWDAPCKADCFETPPGIQPGRNPLTGGGGGRGIVASGGHRKGASHGWQEPQGKMKLLTPYCCTGCSTPDQGAVVVRGGGPAPGLPVFIMKLC